MEVILAVLKDLYTFAFVYWFGLKTDYDNQQPTSSSSEPVAPAPDLKATIQAVTSDTSAQMLLKNPPERKLIAEAPVGLVEQTAYAFTPDTLLYSLPTRTFDGVIERLPYGAAFSILNSQGKWKQVLYGEIKGWIYDDDITDSHNDLNPLFKLGEDYTAEHPSTIKLRTLIDNQFHATDLDVSLQDVEYVTYKLQKKGRMIAWPTERPRIAGTWQRLLKGVHGIHLGVTPKTDSLLEYILPDNTGHIAYVESVFPDGSVAITEVGYPAEGIYHERVLSKNDWKELRPIFIEVA